MKTGFGFSFNRLTVKFLIPLILIFLVLLGTYTYIQVRNYSHEEKGEFFLRFDQSLQLIANTSTGFLWNFNYDELEVNMGHFFVNRELYRITIVDDLGETVIDLIQGEKKGGELLTGNEDIYYQDVYLGQVEIALTSYYYEKRVRVLRNQLLILSLIIFIVLIAVIWMSSKLLITHPIQRLSDILQQFAWGDFQAIPPSLIPVSLKERKDELGVLAQAFDRMSEKLRSMIVDLEHQQEKLQEISYRDILTGLYNRTFLEEEMERLDTIRQLPISIIMADINGLKLVNDTYGHEKGDELLIKTAEILRRSIRSEDLVARWAGDEFVILLPNTTLEEARIIFERIQAHCKEEKDSIPVSLGLGMAVKTHMGQDINGVLHDADEQMYENKLKEGRAAKRNLIAGLLDTLESKSHETQEHIHSLETLALKMGEKLELSHYDLQKISLLSTLHDIGKITIPQEILEKPYPLTEEEWEIMQGHPEKGCHIATATKEFSIVAQEILHHHERWDGGGYPRGLQGDAIPLLSRIFAVVDAYVVMINGRPYKEPMGKEESLQELRQGASGQFDPQLVDLFLELLGS